MVGWFRAVLCCSARPFVSSAPRDGEGEEEGSEQSDEPDAWVEGERAGGGTHLRSRTERGRLASSHDGRQRRDGQAFEHQQTRERRAPACPAPLPATREGQKNRAATRGGRKRGLNSHTPALPAATIAALVHPTLSHVYCTGAVSAGGREPLREEERRGGLCEGPLRRGRKARLPLAHASQTHSCACVRWRGRCWRGRRARQGRRKKSVSAFSVSSRRESWLLPTPVRCENAAQVLRRRRGPRRGRKETMGEKAVLFLGP